MLALKKHADALKVPFRWILYDSWFYSKSDVDKQHPYSYKDGVTNWTEAAPEIFPSGLLSLYERTGWNVVGHNRAWATQNVYDKRNGGRFEFLTGHDNTGLNWSLPVDETFWDYLFETDQKWGLWNCAPPHRPAHPSPRRRSRHAHEARTHPHPRPRPAAQTSKTGCTRSRACSRCRWTRRSRARGRCRWTPRSCAAGCTLASAA